MSNSIAVHMPSAKPGKKFTPTLQNATWTTPEEITAAILYLLSDEAGMMNGAKIPLFGSYN